MISGEAGIGKTALAAVLCREAVDTGVRAVTGHSYDRTQTPPYGPWIQIAERVAAHPDTYSAPIPRLDGATSQPDLFLQARNFITSLSAERPLLLVLEDLHWADSASIDLLRFIARGLGDLPILLVASYRGEDVDRSHPLSATVPLLAREAPTERLNLRPLDVAAAQALVGARRELGKSTVQRLGAYLIERTEGNALFMVELLRSLEENGQIELFDGESYAQVIAQTPVPALLRQIVDDRLARLGDETAALLAIAAVVGQEVPLAVWQAVTRASEETLLAAVERAEAAHLVTASARADALRFSHALIHDVLYEHVPGLRRLRLHLKVAEALIEQPVPDPDAVAYHFQRAGDGRAAEWLVRAAERAEDAYALVTAVERYEAAIPLLDAQEGDAVERGWLRLLLATLRRHEDWDRATAWVEDAIRLAALAEEPSLGARAQALLGLLISYRGDYHGSMATLTVALDRIDRLPPGTGSALRRERLVDKVVNHGTLIGGFAYSGRLTEARSRGERYLTQFAAGATTSIEHGAIADAHMGLALAYAFQGEPEQARRSYAATVAAYHASDNHMLALANLRRELILAVLPYQADDLAERERIVVAAERTAAWVLERGAHGNPNLPRYVRVPLLVLEGRWKDAREILDLPDPSELASLSRVRPIYLGMLARAQGDAETAWRCVHDIKPIRPVSEPGGEYGPLPLHMQRLAVELALDAGDLVAARWWLDLHQRWLDFMEATLGRSEGEVLEAQWHRATGDVARAREHAERALVHATSPRQPLALLAAHRMQGILDANAGEYASAELQFSSAIALAEACMAPYERALTLLAQAELAIAQNDRTAATTLLDEVHNICVPLDARLVLSRVELIQAKLSADRNSAGVRKKFPAGLTAREVDVLRFVAAGLSNAEIAERLFLSPNTVKVHVSRLLSKIGVHNRAAATEFAFRHGIHEPSEL